MPLGATTSLADDTTAILAAGAAVWGLSLTAGQQDSFAKYAELLVEWNASRMNLTRLTSAEQIATGHFLDSLAVTQAVRVPHRARVIDVGTGAGFPGIALKILRPDIILTLVDGTAKKLAFCRAVADALGLVDVETVHVRAEDLGQDRGYRGAFDLVVARAVAPMEKLIYWLAPFAAKTGAVVAWKGEGARREMASADGALRTLRMKARLVDVPIPCTGDPPRTNTFAICERED